MSEYAICLCTCPDNDTAKQIAHAIVSEKAAACVNLIDQVTSVYRWEGAVCQESEVQLVIKTRMDAVSRVHQMIQKLHPYDEPEWLVLSVTEGSQSYLDWIKSSVK